jgi:glycosyltransferase involved in cell wall biosynthesis
MAAAVHRILTEPNLAAKLSIQARAKAEMFAWNQVLDAWEELLLGLSG